MYIAANVKKSTSAKSHGAKTDNLLKNLATPTKPSELTYNKIFKKVIQSSTPKLHMALKYGVSRTIKANPNPNCNLFLLFL